MSSCCLPLFTRPPVRLPACPSACLPRQYPTQVRTHSWHSQTARRLISSARAHTRSGNCSATSLASASASGCFDSDCSACPHSPALCTSLSSPALCATTRGSKELVCSYCWWFQRAWLCRQCDRVAKVMDSKSIGLCPQGLESPRCR